MQATRYKAKDASIKTDQIIVCFAPMIVQHPLVPSLPCDDIIIKNVETGQYMALSQLCIVVNIIHRTQGRNNHNMDECIVYNIVYSMYEVATMNRLGVSRNKRNKVWRTIWG